MFYTLYTYHAPADAPDDLAQLDGLTCYLREKEYHLFGVWYSFVLVVFPLCDGDILINPKRMKFTDLTKI